MLAWLGVYALNYALNIIMQEHSDKEKLGIFGPFLLVKGGEQYFCQKIWSKLFLDQKDLLRG